MLSVRYILLNILLIGTLSAMSLSEVNKASKDELMKIKGVGAAKADAIISARPFKDMQALDDVKGIGEALLGNIQNNVYKKSSSASSNQSSSATKNRATKKTEKSETKQKKTTKTEKSEPKESK